METASGQVGGAEYVGVWWKYGILIFDGAHVRTRILVDYRSRCVIVYVNFRMHCFCLCCLSEPCPRVLPWSSGATLVLRCCVCPWALIHMLVKVRRAC